MIDNIKPTQAAEPAPDHDKSYRDLRTWFRRGGGTSRKYLLSRARDVRPDVVDQWAAEGYKGSIHQLAIRAGILPEIAPEDRALENLMTAWKRADTETREVFLALVEDWEDLPSRRNGPRAIISEGAPPVLLTLRARMPMSHLAKALGVSRETVRRWCAAECQPNPQHLVTMEALAQEDAP